MLFEFGKMGIEDEPKKVDEGSVEVSIRIKNTHEKEKSWSFSI